MSQEESDNKIKYDETINDLTEVVLEGIEEEYKNDLEPFSAYANRLRARIHSQENEFRSRCARGYIVLLEEVMYNMDNGSQS